MMTSTDGINALEFSDDAFPHQIIQDVAAHFSLIQAIMQAIHECGLGETIGLTILRSDAFRGRGQLDRIIEENFEGLSVVVARQPTPDEEGTLIPTTWSLDIYSGCKPACDCRAYQTSEGCKHHAKVHVYKVCVPACVQIEHSNLSEQLPNKRMEPTR